MAELLDSGARREFGNGAVRDVAEGKGRCDLLPLVAVGHFLHDGILVWIEKYIRSGNTENLNVVIASFCMKRGWNHFTAMLEVAKQYEDGARKYDDRNWEKGIPVHVFIDSGVRHYLKFLRGDTDEPHDRAFVWNMLGAIWTHVNKPELIDLPFADKPITAHRPTQAELEDLFATEAKAEPVKGKYEGLSNKELNYAFCAANHGDCQQCLLPNFLGVGDRYFSEGCTEWRDECPEEFRKIAIEWLSKESNT